MSAMDWVMVPIVIYCSYKLVLFMKWFCRAYWTEILDEDERSFFRDPVAYTRKSAKDDKDESDGTG